MVQFIKRILVLLFMALFLHGCSIGAFSTLFLKLGKLLSLLGGGASKLAPVGATVVAGHHAARNPSAVIIVILIIAGIVGAVYYFTKNTKDKPIIKKTTVTPSLIIPIKEETPEPKKEAESENKKEEMQWLERAQSKIPKPISQQKKKEEMQALEKALSKIPKPIDQKKKEEEKTNKDSPKEILTWDESAKSEPKKEEPIKKEPKPTEVTITPQEEEKIYEQVAKELKENRNEGVWLKFFTEKDGDEIKTKIAYTKKRVNTLMEELKIKKLK